MLDAHAPRGAGRATHARHVPVARSRAGRARAAVRRDSMTHRVASAAPLRCRRAGADGARLCFTVSVPTLDVRSASNGRRRTTPAQRTAAPDTAKETS
ncbi:hypothetical protein EGT33_22950 [Burkholderia multivorans]|nr:hypothetical protein EGT33_22950 [Burkholderia multivorans]